jgi:hypothetical protein
MEEVIIFVYAKYGKIKVLGIDSVLRREEELLKDGWVHTQTLNACVFIQYLHNFCDWEDLFDEMKSLSNPIHKNCG